MNNQKHRHIPGIWFLAFPLLGIIMAIITLPNLQLIIQYLGKNATASEYLLLVGKPAPDFATQNLDGTVVSSKEYLGSPVAISFWATWCEPCKTEMPVLQQASLQYQNEHLVVLGVNAGENKNLVSDFVSAQQLSFPILLDPNRQIWKLYGINELPVTFWIDSTGIIRAEELGPTTPELIEAYMKKLKEGS
jgi:cytochrome c biogenesis protein CcmG, thiol:disulfide interchange protein DsbE